MVTPSDGTANAGCARSAQPPGPMDFGFPAALQFLTALTRREVADLMLEEVLKVSPAIFRDAGPGCVRGPCPEGKMSCGHSRKKR